MCPGETWRLKINTFPAFLLSSSFKIGASGSFSLMARQHIDLFHSRRSDMSKHA